MRAFKLMRVRADGTIGPLFCNRKLRVPLNTKLAAEAHPTKGLANRPGWHALAKPDAPHMSTKGRAWFEVELEGVSEHHRPACQGGVWFLAEAMTVIGAL